MCSYNYLLQGHQVTVNMTGALLRLNAETLKRVPLL